MTHRGFHAVVLVAAVVLAGALVWWWGGPVLRALFPMARPEWDRLAPEVRTTAEGQYRLAVVQAAAALGAGVALAYTARNYRLSRRGQVTDRFTKALERLGSEELEVRIGGVLALEQIVQDSPDQATHAAQVLNAFIRQHASLVPAVTHGAAKTGVMGAAALRTVLNRTTTHPRPPERLDADIQAALTALTRPESRRHTHPTQIIDIAGLRLSGARLDQADLTNALLDGSDLTNARLVGANLTNAQLRRANLAGARLVGADLTNAQLRDANLTSAGLEDANLTNTRLRTANLTNARLVGANLTDAWLDGTDLTHTSLGDANFTRAWLAGTALRTASGLTAEQVVSARPWADAKLPPHIAAHPSVIARITEVDPRKEPGR
ncbi:pentapeptide repeat-containing protein [Streptomyces niveus]|uniref:pentapeptide repeat-containing protein n=1 Tax=Streptomyces niveus TaxID=193462 RepID=UPI00367D542D